MYRQRFAQLVLRKKFASEKGISRATVSLCGLGYYILEVDGKRIGDQQLDPGFTQFDKRVLTDGAVRSRKEALS